MPKVFPATGRKNLVIASNGKRLQFMKKNQAGFAQPKPAEIDEPEVVEVDEPEIAEDSED